MAARGFDGVEVFASAFRASRSRLGYRLRRIEVLTGRGFSSTEHLAERWVALRAQRMLEGASGTGAPLDRIG